MNENHRQMVLNYIKEYDDSPLYFEGYTSIVNEFDPKKVMILDMIRRVLKLTLEYPSYDSETEDIQCHTGKYRSVLDIWRHIKFYYPSVEIFDVMHSIFNNYACFGGQFCINVNRRVFILRNQYTPITNFQAPDNMFQYCFRRVDEFGLEWEDWKDI